MNRSNVVHGNGFVCLDERRMVIVFPIPECTIIIMIELDSGWLSMETEHQTKMEKTNNNSRRWQ